MEPFLESNFSDTLKELSAKTAAQKFQRVQPVVINDVLAAELGISSEWLKTAAGAAFLTGQSDVLQEKSVAQIYSGHQFGGYSPRLGDGRAVLLGEIHAKDGSLRDVHLKGSGRTPVSRGDGYATLSAMLREYLMSAALHSLKIPTTRSLAVSLTGNYVRRDGEILPGAILTRIASSHIRVGSFQYARANGDRGLLERLLRFTAKRHLAGEIGDPENEDPRIIAVTLFREVMSRQANLVADWMSVGFVHGVMNTDNMALSGETIDYGPCAFIDEYDEHAVFSSIDTDGRYSYGQQPLMAKWNLARFVETLMPFFSDDEGSALETAKTELENFNGLYEKAFQKRFAKKLGLKQGHEAFAKTLAEAFTELRETSADFTLFFKELTDLASGKSSPNGRDPWVSAWLSADPDHEMMAATNPVRIPRNETVEETLKNAQNGETEGFFEFLEALQNPFQETDEWKRFDTPPTPGSSRFVTYCGT